MQTVDEAVASLAAALTAQITDAVTKLIPNPPASLPGGGSFPAPSQPLAPALTAADGVALDAPNAAALDPCVKLQQRGGWAEDAALHRCTVPIGPRNTWSNLAYALVGVFLALHVHTSGALAMGVALVVLCLGSGYYHAVKTVTSNRFDWVGIYMVFGALTVHSIVPASTVAPWLMLAFGAFVAAYFTNPLNKIDLNAQLGTFLFLSLLPAFFGGGHLLLGGLALAVFLLAYALQLLDEAHSTLTGLWGHAIWHVLSAVAIGLTFVAQP